VSSDPVIARLAAANPFPATAARAGAPLNPRLRRRALVAALAAAVVAVPAVAFAGDIGGLFGFSTQGQPVPTSDTPFSKVSGLNQAMGELGFPSTLQLIATRGGISFYAARRADGRVCVAIDLAPGSVDRKAVGCDLGNPSLPGTPAFPSPERPILDFSRFSNGARFAGFAADGIATVRLLDAAGNVIASARVSDNAYAEADPPAGGAAVEALDGQGNVVYTRSFDEAP
jgi:hypothetical protein